MIKTCKADHDTFIHHVAALDPCCPVSGNPRPGSTMRVSYKPTAGVVLPVEALEEMAREYVGGFGAIRAQEEMMQDIAGRCASIVGAPVRLRASLVIRPPYGGIDQMMRITVRAVPESPV